MTKHRFGCGCGDPACPKCNFPTDDNEAPEADDITDEPKRDPEITFRATECSESRKEDGDDWYRDGKDPLIGPGPYGYGDEKLQTVPENLSDHDLAQLLTFAEDLGEEGGQDRNPFAEEAARRLSDRHEDEGEV